MGWAGSRTVQHRLRQRLRRRHRSVTGSEGVETGLWSGTGSSSCDLRLVSMVDRNSSWPAGIRAWPAERRPAGQVLGAEHEQGDHEDESRPAGDVEKGGGCRAQPSTISSRARRASSANCARCQRLDGDGIHGAVGTARRANSGAAPLARVRAERIIRHSRGCTGKARRAAANDSRQREIMVMPDARMRSPMLATLLVALSPLPVLAQNNRWA